MQINLDIVVAMRCEDLNINVQDAAGDRILAGETLTRDPTLWLHWRTRRSGSGALRMLQMQQELKELKEEEKMMMSKQTEKEKEKDKERKGAEEHQQQQQDDMGVEDVHDFLAAARKQRMFSKTPKLRGMQPDACRIYGILEGNKIQGDFHITARGHGYFEFGAHLDHSGM